MQYKISTYFEVRNLYKLKTYINVLNHITDINEK